MVLDLAGAARRHLPGRSPPPPLAQSMALAYLRRFVVEINAGRQRNLLRLGSPYSRKYQSFIFIAPAELFGNFRVGGVVECMRIRNYTFCVGGHSSILILAFPPRKRVDPCFHYTSLWEAMCSTLRDMPSSTLLILGNVELHGGMVWRCSPRGSVNNVRNVSCKKGANLLASVQGWIRCTTK